MNNLYHAFILIQYEYFNVSLTELYCCSCSQLVFDDLSSLYPQVGILQDTFLHILFKTQLPGKAVFHVSRLFSFCFWQTSLISNINFLAVVQLLQAYGVICLLWCHKEIPLLRFEVDSNLSVFGSSCVFSQLWKSPVNTS